MAYCYLGSKTVALYATRLSEEAKGRCTVTEGRNTTAIEYDCVRTYYLDGREIVSTPF